MSFCFLKLENFTSDDFFPLLGGPVFKSYTFVKGGFCLFAEGASLTPYVEEMVLQLFELVNEKNELFRRQAELMYL